MGEWSQDHRLKPVHWSKPKLSVKADSPSTRAKNMAKRDKRDLPEWVQERRKNMVSKIQIHTGHLSSMPWSQIDTQDLDKLLNAVSRR